AGIISARLWGVVLTTIPGKCRTASRSILPRAGAWGGGVSSPGAPGAAGKIGERNRGGSTRGGKFTIPPDSLENLPYAAAGRGSRWTAYPHCSRRRVRRSTL